MKTSNLKVIIIAAGPGSRLRPLTIDKPKCLLKIGKRSILDRQIKLFQQNQIKDINIIVGYKKEKFKNKNLNLIENKNYQKNNILNSLFCDQKNN